VRAGRCAIPPAHCRPWAAAAACILNKVVRSVANMARALARERTGKGTKMRPYAKKTVAVLVSVCAMVYLALYLVMTGQPGAYPSFLP